MLKHYVEIYYPGAFVSESTIKEVKNREPLKTLPKGAYAYHFFDQEEVKQDGEVLKGKPKNYSPTYYYGTVYTLAQVKKEFPRERILISNMECNGWEKVVKTIRGTFQPLKKGDVVL